MDVRSPEIADPREEIARLEEQIEDLEAKLENCTKLAAASRVALGIGAALLVAGLFGVIGFDATMLTLSMALILGGIVLLGSNSSTAKEAEAQRQAAEARRAELISGIDLHLVEARGTLH